MSFEVPGARALDDVPCRYGESRLLVRGPRRDLDVPYVAFLGSSDTYGKFVDDPFPALVENATGVRSVNLGCVNAGVDAFLNDEELIRISAAAKVTVLQVMGAQNLSNKLYRVHPRRNDRFLEPTPLLTKMYPEVDFTEFNFNKHMLSTLLAVSPDRFRAVRSELRAAWLARMRLLVSALTSPVFLLWLRRDLDRCAQPAVPIGEDPLLVTSDMIEELGAACAGWLDIPVRLAGATGELESMAHGPLQAPVAERSIGPDTHARIATRLAERLQAVT